jgi:hypothetical protein
MWMLTWEKEIEIKFIRILLCFPDAECSYFFLLICWPILSIIYRTGTYILTLGTWKKYCGYCEEYLKEQSCSVADAADDPEYEAQSLCSSHNDPDSSFCAVIVLWTSCFWLYWRSPQTTHEETSGQQPKTKCVHARMCVQTRSMKWK